MLKKPENPYQSKRYLYRTDRAPYGSSQAIQESLADEGYQIESTDLNTSEQMGTELNKKLFQKNSRNHGDLRKITRGMACHIF